MNPSTTKLAPVTAFSPVKTNTLVSMLIQPVAENDKIVEAWGKYSELKAKLLSALDYQLINGKQHIKKSGWRKLATAFAVSDEIIKEERKELGKGYIYEVTVKASAQNGRFASGVGSCSSLERNFSHPDHDIRSTAHTRAKNRAISDLIGGGEVSADELETSASRPVSYNVTNVVKEPQIKVAEAVSNNEPDSWGREYEASKITDRQKALLTELINQVVDDDDDRQAQLDNIPSLNKSDASELIGELISTKKVNSY